MAQSFDRLLLTEDVGVDLERRAQVAGQPLGDLISRDAAGWIGAYRAARGVTVPCCVIAAILDIVALAGAEAIASERWGT